VNIKHTGWEEMLLQEDRQRLAAWYVAAGDFREKLKKWVRRGGGSRAVTTPEMRGNVGHELAGLLTVQNVLYECLDYMAAVVGAGVETRLAWSYVLT
jgi:hypothetical protein